MLHHTGFTSLFVLLMAANAFAGAHGGDDAEGWLPLESQVRQQFPSVVLDSHASLHSLWQPSRGGRRGQWLRACCSALYLRGGRHLY